MRVSPLTLSLSKGHPTPVEGRAPPRPTPHHPPGQPDRQSPAAVKPPPPSPAYSAGAPAARLPASSHSSAKSLTGRLNRFNRRPNIQTGAPHVSISNKPATAGQTSRQNGWMETSGAPGRTRTRNPWVRSPVLYPLSYRRKGETGNPAWNRIGTELEVGASDGIRTRDLLCHRQAP